MPPESNMGQDIPTKNVKIALLRTMARMPGFLYGGTTPLMAAVSEGDLKRVKGCLHDMQQTAKSEEKFRSALNTQDERHCTALDIACFRGWPDIVERLLGAGADPNVHAANDKGAPSPITIAIAAAQEQARIDGSLKAYQTCIELILAHPSFDLTAHDEGGDLNPLTVCFAHSEEGKQDIVMHDAVAAILARGFDPNKKGADHRHLHLALLNGYYNCAIALVLAGADLHATSPVFGASGEFTFSEIAGVFKNAEYSRFLQQCYRATRAMSGSKWRRSVYLKGNSTKLINRTITTAKHLVSFGRPLEAKLLLRSILWTTKTDFQGQDRFKMLYCLVGLYFLARDLDCKIYCGRLLLSEYPRDTMAKLHVACSLLHPSDGLPAENNIKWVRTVVAVAQHQLGNNSLSLEHGSFTENDVRIRLEYLQQCLQSIEVHKKFILVVWQAESLHQRGNFDKAIEVYGTFNQQSPTCDPSYCILAKGLVLRKQSKALLNAFHSSSTEDLLGQCSMDQSGDNYSWWRAIKEKLETALSVFDSFETKDNQLGAAVAFERIIVLLLLGRYENLVEIATESMKRVLRVRCKPNQTDCMNPSLCDDPGQSDHFMTPKALISAFHERRQVLMLCFWEDVCASYGGIPRNLLKESVLPKLQYLDSPSYTLPHCTPLSPACHVIMDKCEESGELDKEAMLAANCRAKSLGMENLKALTAIRIQVATLILKEAVLTAHSQGCSPRVVGTLLQEALDWNPDLVIPEELKNCKRHGVHPKEVRLLWRLSSSPQLSLSQSTLLR